MLAGLRRVECPVCDLPARSLARRAGPRPVREVQHRGCRRADHARDPSGTLAARPATTTPSAGGGPVESLLDSSSPFPAAGRGEASCERPRVRRARPTPTDAYMQAHPAARRRGRQVSPWSWRLDSPFSPVLCPRQRRRGGVRGAPSEGDPDLVPCQRSAGQRERLLAGSPRGLVPPLVDVPEGTIPRGWSGGACPAGVTCPAPALGDRAVAGRHLATSRSRPLAGLTGSRGHPRVLCDGDERPVRRYRAPGGGQGWARHGRVAPRPVGGDLVRTCPACWSRRADLRHWDGSAPDIDRPVAAFASAPLLELALFRQPRRHRRQGTLSRGVGSRWRRSTP